MGRYSSDWDMGIIYPMFRVPNGWRVNDDGSMTSRIETDEYRMAVEFMADLYKEGAFHPDSAGMQFEEALQLFKSGRTGIHVDGGNIYGKDGFIETIRQYAPEAEIERLIPFGHDGGAGVTYNLPGLFGFTAIPITHEGNDERIHELLRIFDWLSAPFGSEEWLYKSYGIEGTHFEYNENGFPVRTDLGDQEEGGLTAYIGGSLGVFTNADEPELGPLQMEEAKAIYELGIDDPTQGLFSPSAIDNNATLGQLVADTLSNIITGRDDISALDTLVSDWKSRGGDDIRAEYEAEYANNQG
jgi:putative aldouronate transport system substrate-binding protein